MKPQYVILPSEAEQKAEKERRINNAIQTAVFQIKALKPRKLGSNPPTLLNRPRAKLHAICIQFCKQVAPHASSSDEIKAAWLEVEARCKATL